jgi:hypothetical protein
MTIDYIRWLHEEGLGEVNDIEVVGDGVEAVYKKWDRGPNDCLT